MNDFNLLFILMKLAEFFNVDLIDYITFIFYIVKNSFILESFSQEETVY